MNIENTKWFPYDNVPKDYIVVGEDYGILGYDRNGDPLLTPGYLCIPKPAPLSEGYGLSNPYRNIDAEEK